MGVSWWEFPPLLSHRVALKSVFGAAGFANLACGLQRRPQAAGGLARPISNNVKMPKQIPLFRLQKSPLPIAGTTTQTTLRETRARIVWEHRLPKDLRDYK